MYVDANGIRINYRLDGRQGFPWVTFITGIANDTTMWDGQIPALEDDFNVLRIATRGHGGTQATNGDYTFDMLMNDVVGVWDALDIRQSHLVGLGLGGSTSIGLAINHSERLISLTACACRAVMVPELQAIWPGLVEMAKTGGMKAVAETTVQRWFTEEFRAANLDVLDSVRRQILGTDLQGYFGCIAAFMTLNFIDKIGGIKVPTLFISGADDQRGGPAPVMQNLADSVPGARHQSIPDTAHICNIQNPVGFNKVLGTFLRSH